MNMKKLTASVIAGVVAVSAMATSAFAAETVKTYNLTSSGYKAEYSNTFTSGAPAAAVLANEGSLTLTFTDNAATPADFDNLASVTAKLTVVNTTPTPNTSRTVDVTFKQKSDDKNVFTLAIKSSGIAGAGEAVIGAAESITNAVYTIKTKKIDCVDPDGTGTKTKADDKERVLKVTTATAGVAPNPAPEVGALDLAPGATTTELKLAGTPAQGVPSVTAAGKYDFKTLGLSTNYVAFVNNFFADGSNGKIVLTLEAVAANGTAGGPNNDITLGKYVAKDFGLAANHTWNNKLVSAQDAVDGKVTFSVDDLTAAMGKNFVGNIQEMALVVGPNALASLNAKEIKIKSISYVKDDAAAVTEATTETATTEATTEATTAASTPAADDSNPKTGAAPVALALIPAALAAVVVAKKRK